jgi:prepilin-type N-terminal cleavage/methylation domain-containing protein
MRKGFTLIEMMISVTILSIIMLFLYKSYAELNLSNKTYEHALDKLQTFELVKKVLYLDFSLADKVQILKQDKQHDVVFLSSMHSIHERINPNIAYFVKENHLYRLESFRPFRTYPLDAQSDFVADDLGEVRLLRIYPGKADKTFFLLHILFSKKEEIILKVKALNI